MLKEGKNNALLGSGSIIYKMNNEELIMNNALRV